MNKASQKKQESGRGRFFDGVNRILLILTLGLIGSITFKYYSPVSSLKLPSDGEKVGKTKQVSVEAYANKIKPFSVYEQAIRRRNLFQPITEKITSGSKTSRKVLPELPTRIRLVGILLDDDSKAIVEDLKEGQTYFLSKGDRLGSALLEEIRQDKVVFLYDDERIEMVP